MTNEERRALESMLAEKRQRYIPGLSDDAAWEELVRACRRSPEQEIEGQPEAWRQQEAAQKKTLLEENRVLRQKLEDIRQRQVQKNRRLGRRSRTFGFLAGIALALTVVPLAAVVAAQGWRLFRWLAGLLKLSPEALAGVCAVSLGGLLLLRNVKAVGRWWLAPDELEDEDLYDEEA